MPEVKRLEAEDVALLAEYDDTVVRCRYARTKLDELVLKATLYRLEDMLQQRGLLDAVAA